MNWSVVCHQSGRPLLYQKMRSTYITSPSYNVNGSDWCTSLTGELVYCTAWAVPQFGTVYVAVLTLFWSYIVLLIVLEIQISKRIYLGWLLNVLDLLMHHAYCRYYQKSFCLHIFFIIFTSKHLNEILKFNWLISSYNIHINLIFIWLLLDFKLISTLWL